MAAPLQFAPALLRRMPPWLRRARGAKVVLGLADTLDTMAGDLVDAVALRFPTSTSDPAALALIGSERRIRRGPGEDAATYASRLAPWLDDHRTRGGPYALARQLYLFWRTALGADFEIVYTTGRRFSVDGATGVVVRDDLADWTGGGDATQWAQFWLFFHVTGLSATLVDELGRSFVADGGAEILADVLSGGALTDDETEAFACVPREWKAAHIKRITIVLLYGAGFVYGYPPGVTYGSGKKYGVDVPARVVVED